MTRNAQNKEQVHSYEWHRLPLFYPGTKAIRITTRPLNNGDTPNVKTNNGPIWLPQCCTQFKVFENKTFCFKYFNVILIQMLHNIMQMQHTDSLPREIWIGYSTTLS